MFINYMEESHAKLMDLNNHPLVWAEIRYNHSYYDLTIDEMP